MTISADEAADGDRLERTLALYRDLTMALRERITLLEAGIDDDKVERRAVKEVVRDHQKTLQAVLEIEASLGKRTKAGGEGASGELDLDAARAEIVQRLAVWAAAR